MRESHLFVLWIYEYSYVTDCHVVAEIHIVGDPSYKETTSRGRTDADAQSSV